MKNSDQKKLESIYESEVLEEGVWDQIAHKAGTIGKGLGGMAANIGNRLANTVRSSENQKNPTEAQVQHLWNSFRTKTLGAIEQYLKSQAKLIDYEMSDKSVISKQIAAIKEAQKFLQDPPSYLQTAKPIVGSPESGGGDGGGGSSGGGGGTGGVESSNSKTTSTRGGGGGSSEAPPRRSGTDDAKVVNPTANVEKQNLKTHLQANPDDLKKVLDILTKNPDMSPEITTELEQLLDKVINSTDPDLVAILDSIRQRIGEKLTSETPEKPIIPPSSPKEKDPILAMRDRMKAAIAKPGSLATFTPHADKVEKQVESFANLFLSSHAGMKLLFEVTYEDPNLAEEIPKNVIDGANREGEDVRFHGSKPLIVQIMKFFEQFRRECEQFIDNYDNVRKMGKYGQSTADKKIFYTIDKFLKRLLLILYIPGAGNLQGANPFQTKMK